MCRSLPFSNAPPLMFREGEHSSELFFVVVFGQHHVVEAVRPGGLKFGDLPVNRAIRVVCARQVAGGYQELLDDLPAGKHEGPLEQRSPVFQGLQMMAIQPSFERSMLCPQALYAARILDCCIHLQSIPNYARIAEQSGSICLTIRCNFVDIKLIVCGTKITGFFQNRDPGKPRLINLQNETLKEQMVII